MREKIHDAIRAWAREHGLVDLPAFITDDEIADLATMIEGVILDYYAKTLKDPE